MNLSPFQGLDLSPTAKRLLAGRALRSISQGALAVDSALYLYSLGWTGVQIGGLLSGIGIFNAVLSITAGPVSDRKGRRPLLLIYQIVLMLSSLVLIFTAQTAILVLAGVLSGLGRGANGAAGPFGPIEQAWLSQEIQPQQRARIYSLNSSLGFFGMALGALLAAIPAIVQPFLHGSLAYRPLFVISLITSALGFILLYGAHDDHPALIPKTANSLPRMKKKRLVTAPEKQALLRMFAMNTLNSAAIGLTGPLISYWFLMKFHVGPGIQGPVQAITLVFTGISSHVIGGIADRVGLIKSVVWSRGLGLLMLILLPIMPTYWLAAGLYLLRSVFNRGTIGTRQAMIPGLVSSENQGLAFSVSGASAQLPQAFGPMITGPLIAAGWLDTPFYISALLQAFYVGLYTSVFSRYDIVPASKNKTAVATPAGMMPENAAKLDTEFAALPEDPDETFPSIVG